MNAEDTFVSLTLEANRLRRTVEAIESDPCSTSMERTAAKKQKKTLAKLERKAQKIKLTAVQEGIEQQVRTHGMARLATSLKREEEDRHMAVALNQLRKLGALEIGDLEGPERMELGPTLHLVEARTHLRKGDFLSSWSDDDEEGEDDEEEEENDERKRPLAKKKQQQEEEEDKKMKELEEQRRKLSMQISAPFSAPPPPPSSSSHPMDQPTRSLQPRGSNGTTKTKPISEATKALLESIKAQSTSE